VSDKTFQLEILTLQKLFLQQAVRFVVATGQEGVFEILPDHAPFVFALKPGALLIRAPDGNDGYVVVGKGSLIVQKERTTVLARSAERAEEIDVERAQRARERAEDRLRLQTSGIDVARAQAALQRALARLKVAGYRQVEK